MEDRSKIYICTPYVDTGGPKSLHQLANVLMELGYTVYIFYYDDKFLGRQKILYEFCKARVIDSVPRSEDKQRNLLLTSECFTGILNQYRYIRKVIWWLSLDAYLYREDSIYERTIGNITNKYSIPNLALPFVKLYIKYIISRALSMVKPRQIKQYYNLYNCEYVHLYLMSNNVPKKQMRYLCGPIDMKNKYSFNEIISKKENIITYNPAKVDNSLINIIIEKIHAINDEITIMPIKSMTGNEVYHTLVKSKIYIDLGSFPGPERIPREAVLCYNNIITSNVGAASNYTDVPIPECFKFYPSIDNVERIVKLVIVMIQNYADYISLYDEYRNKVMLQMSNFENDVKDAFRNIIE